MQENPMKQIKIEKVTLNIGCGSDQQKIERAKKLLEILTEIKPVVTQSHKRSTFGVPEGEPIGAKVTLRKDSAEKFFKKVLEAVDNKIRSSQLDERGNISIGIKEYIDLPGIKYKHEVGMLGFDCAVTLQRAGYRIKYRRIQQKDIPPKPQINKEEVVNWLKQQGVTVE